MGGCVVTVRDTEKKEKRKRHQKAVGRKMPEKDGLSATGYFYIAHLLRTTPTED